MAYYFSHYMKNGCQLSPEIRLCHKKRRRWIRCNIHFLFIITFTFSRASNWIKFRANKVRSGYINWNFILCLLLEKRMLDQLPTHWVIYIFVFLRNKYLFEWFFLNSPVALVSTSVFWNNNLRYMILYMCRF